jgi:leucyl-tRNA synthetase
MSKSTGNFMTIREAVDQYGADATRLAMASSSLNTISDGSFELKSCDASVLNLYTEIEQIKKLLNNEFRDSLNIWDKYIINKTKQSF